MINVKKPLSLAGVLLLTTAFVGCETNCVDCTSGWRVDIENKPDAFQINSPAFLPGDPLPEAYTCEGKSFADGILPELLWTDGPEGTKSYAIVLKDLTLEDSDTPDYAYHWTIWDIPTSFNSLPEGLEESPMPAGLGGAQQLNGGPDGSPVYFGPCPSWQTACDIDVLRSLDIYAFTIYALNVKNVTLPEADPNIANYVRQLDAYFESIAIDQAEILVSSDASPGTAPAFCPEE